MSDDDEGSLRKGLQDIMKASSNPNKVDNNRYHYLHELLTFMDLMLTNVKLSPVRNKSNKQGGTNVTSKRLMSADRNESSTPKKGNQSFSANKDRKGGNQDFKGKEKQVQKSMVKQHSKPLPAVETKKPTVGAQLPYKLISGSGNGFWWEAVEELKGNSLAVPAYGIESLQQRAASVMETAVAEHAKSKR